MLKRKDPNEQEPKEETPPFEVKPLTPQVCMSELMYWAKKEGTIGVMARLMLEETQMGRSYFCEKTGCLAIKGAYSGDVRVRAGECIDGNEDYESPQNPVERSNVLAGINETEHSYD